MLRPIAQPCEGCGIHYNRLFDAFVNDKGWQRLCGGCSEPPQSGPPRAYTGPYPIRSPRPAPTLRLVASTGDARR